MQFIHKDRVESKLPEDWHKYVQKCWDYVDKKVKEAEDLANSEGLGELEINKRLVTARKKAINQKSGLWRLFAKSVASINNNKCWYCESVENRSNMPVDHFRPKGRVEGSPEHGGYWWLAFDWENYRYCCTYCNSLASKKSYTVGKGDKFPLLDFDKRWMHSQQQCVEAPVILDPFVSGDTRRLTFSDTNGAAIPNFKCYDLKQGCRKQETDDCKSKCQRVLSSIDILNLNSTKTRTSRMRVARNVHRIIVMINRLLDNSKNGVDIESELEFYENQLVTYLDEDAPYRTAAKIFFRGYRTNQNSEWFDEFTDRI
ncbi:hypothetical protein CSB62_19175 [Vibrio splendidus]|nr:hypothetical protein CSB62_19175 [Vibrio splendidus]